MMKRIIVVLLAIAAVTLFIHVPSASAAVSNWQKGVSVQSRYSEDFASASFRQSIDAAANNGVNYVTLVVPVHQDSIYSSYVYAGGDTPSDSALRSGLNYIKNKGMQTAIAIHDNPNDGEWRAHIKASDTRGWFASYGSLVNKYAGIAQSTGVSQMIIGTELSSMTIAANTSQWVSLIANVRTYFKGSLTYSAQRMGHMSDAQTLGFWPQLDKIGLSAYYGLGSDGSVDALMKAWNRYNQQEVSVLAAKYGKQVVFTEIGYVSRDGATNDPGSGWRLTTPVNTNLQANAYQAMFQYWANDPNLAGVFLWDWSSDPNAGGMNDGGYTPQNKPAQDVMKRWFTQSGTQPTAPVVQPAAAYTVSSTVTGTATTGSIMNVPVTISASSTANNMIVDIEIYNAQNQRVAQQYFEQQQLTTAAETYTATFTPTTTGTYTVKVGIFTSGWQSAALWNDSLKTFVVSAPSAPAPIPAPTPQPTPTQPAAPANTPKEISIWWPGGTVSGVQPYKAVVDGRDLGSYDMYWQVDSGTLNKMDDDYNPVAHKESIVDMTNWNWSATGNYTITFVAKDKSGQVLSQKSVVIKVVR